jgi:hypothetical protein
MNNIELKNDIYITTIKILEKRLDNFQLQMEICQHNIKDLQNKIQWHYIVGILFMIYVLYKL